jgi:hypothetical protein
MVLAIATVYVFHLLAGGECGVRRWGGLAAGCPWGKRKWKVRVGRGEMGREKYHFLCRRPSCRRPFDIWVGVRVCGYAWKWGVVGWLHTHDSGGGDATS